MDKLSHDKRQEEFMNQLKENKLGKQAMYASIIDFIQLYSGAPVRNNKRTCIIHHGNSFKLIWDLSVLLILLIISLIVPYRLAFIQTESDSWFTIYLITDTIFLIDIVLTFFTSFHDEQKAHEETDRKNIAKKYLKGWFWVDLISILPIDYLLKDE